MKIRFYPFPFSLSVSNTFYQHINDFYHFIKTYSYKPSFNFQEDSQRRQTSQVPLLRKKIYPEVKKVYLWGEGKLLFKFN